MRRISVNQVDRKTSALEQIIITEYTEDRACHGSVFCSPLGFATCAEHKCELKRRKEHTYARISTSQGCTSMTTCQATFQRETAKNLIAGSIGSQPPWMFLINHIASFAADPLHRLHADRYPVSLCISVCKPGEEAHSAMHARNFATKKSPAYLCHP